jgi:2-dehydro-3-deoxyphosphooctonate aldolase (KDO 8-P synthase)
MLDVRTLGSVSSVSSISSANSLSNSGNAPANDLFIIAGPCLAESKDLLREVVSVMKPLCTSLSLPYVFKASYRKANRTSAASFEGVGDEQALGWLADLRAEFDVPILTDIHSIPEAERAASFGVDVLQIPAFLSRQTDIIRAAADTGKLVNIKKGQFLAPDDMAKAVEKARTQPHHPHSQQHPVWATERGTSFGYHDLVVDMRSLVIMRESLHEKNCRVVYDATHSVQQPSVGEQSGGRREFIPALARAAVAVGVDGLFFEVHPDPARAKSDAATQLSLREAEPFLRQIQAIHQALRLPI